MTQTITSEPLYIPQVVTLTDACECLQRQHEEIVKLTERVTKLENIAAPIVEKKAQEVCRDYDCGPT